MLTLLTSIYPLITSSFQSSFRRNAFSIVAHSYSRYSSIVNSRVFLMLEEPNGNKYQEEIIFGPQAINQLVNAVRYEVPPLRHSNIFMDWFQTVGTRKLATDSEYRSKLIVREIKQKYAEVLDPICARLKKAKDAFESTAEFVELKELEKAITGGEHAVSSMDKFLLENQDSTIPKIAEKIESVRSLLPIKRKDLESNVTRYEELRSSCSAMQEYEEALAQYESIASAVGLTSAEQFKSDAQREGGSGRNVRGKSFESQAVEVVRSCLLPYLSEKHNVPVEDMLIVQNLGLGMASAYGSTAEIDSIICVRNGTSPKPRGTHVTVLGIVEVKRNPDDIGHAFVNYQAPLAWLTGQSDPADSARWITKSYPKGVFDRPFIQVYQGEPLIFTRDSFSKLSSRSITSIIPAELQSSFEISTGSKMHFVDDLFFIVKDGPIDCIVSRSVATALSLIADCEELDASNAINGERQAQALDSIRAVVHTRYPSQLTTFDLLNLYKKLNSLNQLFVVK